MSDGNREPPKKGIPAEYVVLVIVGIVVAIGALWLVTELVNGVMNPAPPAKTAPKNPAPRPEVPPPNPPFDPGNP